MTLPLILTVGELRDALNTTQRRLRIVDLRSEEAYEAGHVPGAVHMNAALLNRPSPPVAGLLPTRATLNELLLQSGVSTDEHIVACDTGGATDAARLIWVLHCYGYDACSLLDGGFNAWTSAGCPVESGSVAVSPGSLKLGEAMADGPVLEADDLLSQLESSELIPLDVRSVAEYVGTDVRSAMGGHVPGAVHFEWTNVLQSDGRLKPADVLKHQLSELGLTPEQLVVPYCQSHQRSSLTYVVLRHLGFNRVKALDGAWSSWGNRADLPKRTGPDA